MRTAGVLALQGAVDEHLEAIRRVGWQGMCVKRPEDLAHIEALIIPGGESTAISRLMIASGLHDAIKQFTGPVMGTCAGLILVSSGIAVDEDNPGGVEGGRGEKPLASSTSNEHTSHRVVPLGLMNAIVHRNGFGRQVDSFEADLDVVGIGEKIPGVFIRAPYIQSLGDEANVLATFEGHIVMAEQGKVLVCSFHPELTEDDRVLEYFLAKA